MFSEAGFDNIVEIAEGIRIDSGTVFYPRPDSENCADFIHRINAADHAHFAPVSLSLLDRLVPENMSALQKFAMDDYLTINVQRRFEVLAQTNPGAIAIRTPDARLTYGELDEQADGLAVLLQQQEMMHGAICAICMAPSIALARAQLAVLKAGAVSVMIDPAADPAWLRAVLARCTARLVLTQADVPALPLPAGTRQLRCDEDGAGLPLAWPHEYPTHRLSPAYALAALPAAGQAVVYGSHLAAIDRLLTIQVLSPINHGDAVLQHPHQAPSAFPWDVMWPLSQGAMLLIPAPGELSDPRRLRQLLRRERVAAMHILPALLDGANDASHANPEPLRALFHRAAPKPSTVE